jgi:hypothetical protein
VYDVVLLPPPAVGRHAVSVSESLLVEGTEFTLGEELRCPHISLYMANFRPEDLPEVTKRLAALAANSAALPLAALRYGHNRDEGMFEVFYPRTPAIELLQQEIINALNPLRQGLRHRDPVGRLLAEWIDRTSPEARRNLERYGYDEVGGLFEPHITLTRFVRRDHQVDLAMLPPLPVFDATCSVLALYDMGEHGTCLAESGRWEL